MTAKVHSIGRAARRLFAAALALRLTGAAHAICCAGGPAPDATARAEGEQIARAGRT